jgi:hypothetical protein
MTRTNERRPAGNGAADDQAAAASSIATRVTRETSMLPVANTSVFAQVGSRTMLHAAATCPICLGVTVHRLSGPEVDGIERQGACRHFYRLRTRRVYAPRVGRGAA